MNSFKNRFYPIIVYFRHEDKSVRSHSPSVLHLGLYILKIFVPVQNVDNILVDNIWIYTKKSQQRSYGCDNILVDNLTHLRFPLFLNIIQICSFIVIFFDKFAVEIRFSTRGESLLSHSTSVLHLGFVYLNIFIPVQNVDNI